jgi:hypothetical protein
MNMYMNTDKNGPVGSNTDSGSKRGVQCRDSSILYLAFIIINLILI